MTVWTLFGSDEACAGAGGGAGAATDADGGAGFIGGGGGQTVSVADATAGPFCAGAPELEPVTIGIVDTTRGAAFGGSIATGCSSRETRLSVEPVVPGAACLESPAFAVCAAAAVGVTLIGPLLA